MSSRNRQIVPMPAATPALASSVWISASVVSDRRSINSRNRAECASIRAERNTHCSLADWGSSDFAGAVLLIKNQNTSSAEFEPRHEGAGQRGTALEQCGRSLSYRRQEERQRDAFR
jgi:hypothetical protein